MLRYNYRLKSTQFWESVKDGIDVMTINALWLANGVPEFRTGHEVRILIIFNVLFFVLWFTNTFYVCLILEAECVVLKRC